MASKTEIANEVAINLGKDPVDNIDTAVTPFAERFNQIYTSALKEVLNEHDWSFATRECKLLAATIPNPELTEYAYYYELPPDYVHLIQDGDDRERVSNYSQYRVEANYLLSNDSEVIIKYVALITETTIFPPKFVTALIMKLSHKLAYYMTSNRNDREGFRQDYERELINAIGRDQRVDKTFQYNDSNSPQAYHDRLIYD